MHILFIIIGILLCCYTIFILYLWIFHLLFFKKETAAFSSEKVSEKTTYPNVSIVIPFRNEAKNLNSLLNSLNTVKYEGNFEVILINDSSTDESLKVIEGIRAVLTFPCRVLENTFDQSTNMSSKQQALVLGINAAQFECIVLTDADMEFTANWLSYYGNEFRKGADFVIGHTGISITEESSIFENFQALQLSFLFSIAFAFHNVKILGSCMGNNVGFTKESYLKVGGHKAIGYSIVEDRDLLNLYHENNLTIKCTNPFTISAWTKPCSTVSQYYHQLRRWAMGGFRIKNNLFWIGLLTGVQLWMSILIFIPSVTNILKLIVLFNFMITFLFSNRMFTLMQLRISIFRFIFLYMSLVLESTLGLLLLLFGKKTVWKGRQVETA